MTNKIGDYFSASAQNSKFWAKLRAERPLSSLLADAAQGLSIAMTAMEEVAEQSQEERILLTRNTKLALRRPKDRIITITEDNPSRQLKEVVQKGRLFLDEEILYTRCLLCNDPIHPIPREEAEGKVPDFIFSQQRDFYRCPKCRRIYWQGSHLENMAKKVEELRRTAQ